MGFGVWGLGVWGLGFGLWALGFGLWGLGASSSGSVWIHLVVRVEIHLVKRRKEGIRVGLESPD